MYICRSPLERPLPPPSPRHTPVAVLGPTWAESQARVSRESDPTNLHVVKRLLDQSSPTSPTGGLSGPASHKSPCLRFAQQWLPRDTCPMVLVQMLVCQACVLAAVPNAQHGHRLAFPFGSEAHTVEHDLWGLLSPPGRRSDHSPERAASYGSSCCDFPSARWIGPQGSTCAPSRSMRRRALILKLPS